LYIVQYNGYKKNKKNSPLLNLKATFYLSPSLILI